MTQAKRPKFERRLILGKSIIFAAVAKKAAVVFSVRPNWNDESKSRGYLDLYEDPREGRELTAHWCPALNGPCCHQRRHRFSLRAKEVLVPMFHYHCEIESHDYEEIWQEIEAVLQHLIDERKSDTGGD